MNIVVVGLSHKTASVDIREKVAFALPKLRSAKSWQASLSRAEL